MTATFTTNGIRRDVTVVVITGYIDGIPTEVSIQLPRVAANVIGNGGPLGELRLEDGRRWLAYYNHGRFELASGELTEQRTAQPPTGS